MVCSPICSSQRTGIVENPQREAMLCGLAPLPSDLLCAKEVTSDLSYCILGIFDSQISLVLINIH